MIGLSFEFDLGRYHATPWGRNVNDGVVEWPPSVWRVLRALYAVARTNTLLHEQQQDIDRALSTLAQAPPPVFTLPPSTAAHTRHYLPSRRHSPTRPGETDRVLDAFRALARDAKLEIWWRAELDDDARAALAAAAGALGYLGRSESVCTAALVQRNDTSDNGLPLRFDGMPAVDAAHADTCEQAEIVDLLCFARTVDHLQAMSVSVGELRHKRLARPPGTDSVQYIIRAPSAPQATRHTVVERPTFARFRVRGGARPSLYDAVAAAEALRRALQSRYGAANSHDTSPVFSGRDGDHPRREQHTHAHYLATPGSDGRRIEHMTVWALEGFGVAEVAALAALRKVSHWSFDEPFPVVLAALGRPEEMHLPDLLGPATDWRSLTPFALPRHLKRRGGRVVETPEDQIRREWTLRNPDRADVLVNAELLPPGRWHQFRRTRTATSRRVAPRVVGAILHFSEPVSGPIALGALSHFGLGLFVPLSILDN